MLVLVCTILYVAGFNWSYKAAVATVYAFYGLSYSDTAWPYLLASWVASIVPAIWMPITISRPSQLFFFIQYYIIFIPSCFGLYNVTHPIIPAENVFILILIMLAGLSIMQFIYYIPIPELRQLRVTPRLFWVVFLSVLLALAGYIILAFGSNFRFADFEEIYAVRSRLAQEMELSGTRLGSYAQMWLSGFFLPFCFAVGVFSRRWWLLAMAGAGYVVLFGIGGSKMILLAILYFPLIYLWLRYGRRYAVAVLPIGLCLLLSFGILLRALDLTTVARWYVLVVNFRSFGIPAQLMAQYYDFFSNNPLTYLSHVHGIDTFVAYPYTMDLGRTLGFHYFHGPVGLNAGFWAGDGLASFGLPGIIIMSFVVRSSVLDLRQYLEAL